MSRIVGSRLTIDGCSGDVNFVSLHALTTEIAVLTLSDPRAGARATEQHP